jgi:UDP-N-acetylmuramoyl-tripeptide--D-alanyl-D-alanine ligase
MGSIATPDVWEATKDVLVASQAPPDASFERGAIDSREVRSGDLFFAVQGERQDGHEFISQALDAGATGAVVERPIEPPDCAAVFHVSDSLHALQRLAAAWRRRHELDVIAVTGSVGKTTCKELIASVLSKRFRTLKSEANFNTEIGIPLTLLQLREEHDRAVLEFGMYARGDIALLSRIALPRIGVVTNIGPVHMERLGSQGAITAAKAELVEALPANGVAVLNGDDARTAALEARTDARIVYYGLSEQCDVRACEVTTRSLEGIDFRLLTPAGEEDAHLPLPGKHHAYPALAATAVALEYGMSLAEITTALAETTLDLRGRVLPGTNGATIIDDSYNASPAAMIAQLDLLSELPGRHIALLGDMLELGPGENAGHSRVGERAAQVCDLLLTVGERARVIAEQALGKRAEVRHLSTTTDAIDLLKRELRPGDHLLIKASRAMKFEGVVEALAGQDVGTAEI